MSQSPPLQLLSLSAAASYGHSPLSVLVLTEDLLIRGGSHDSFKYRIRNTTRQLFPLPAGQAIPTESTTYLSSQFPISPRCQHQSCVHTQRYPCTACILSLTFAAPSFYSQPIHPPTACKATTKNRTIHNRQFAFRDPLLFCQHQTCMRTPLFRSTPCIASVSSAASYLHSQPICSRSGCKSSTKKKSILLVRIL